MDTSMNAQPIEMGIGDNVSDADQYLTFLLNGEEYGVDILRVQVINSGMATTQIPNTPEYIRGVMNLRGAIVPIIDLRLRFGLESSARTRRTKWVVVELDGRAVGLVVDAVTEVFGTTSADERAVPALGRGDDVRGIAQVFNHGGKLVFVIDVARVAAPARGLDVDAVAMAALSELPPPPSPLGGTPNAPAPQRGKSRRP